LKVKLKPLIKIIQILLVHLEAKPRKEIVGFLSQLASNIFKNV